MFQTSTCWPYLPHDTFLLISIRSTSSNCGSSLASSLTSSFFYTWTMYWVSTFRSYHHLYSNRWRQLISGHQSLFHTCLNNHLHFPKITLFNIIPNHILFLQPLTLFLQDNYSPAQPEAWHYSEESLGEETSHALSKALKSRWRSGNCDTLNDRDFLKTFHDLEVGMSKWVNSPNSRLFFGLCHMAYGVLVPWPEIEARARKVSSPNHWTTRELPTIDTFKKYIFILIFFFFAISCIMQILAPWPGVKPTTPLQWKLRILTTGLPWQSSG